MVCAQARTDRELLRTSAPVLAPPRGKVKFRTPALHGRLLLCDRAGLVGGAVSATVGLTGAGYSLPPGGPVSSIQRGTTQREF